ncbi:30S ribosomal protein S24e [Halorutilales archaeon Cl-col2-1]|nr:30S ribosomal protein S24e [Halobacteria archaeon]
MQIDITDEEENSLLDRKEIEFSIVHDEETPSRLAVRDSLTAKLGKSSDEVVVHSMKTKRGINETVGYAKVYDSAEAAREVEEEYMLERNKIGAEEGEEEAEA